jgi:hypothetical protein
MPKGKAILTEHLLPLNMYIFPTETKMGLTKAERSEIAKKAAKSRKKGKGGKKGKGKGGKPWGPGHPLYEYIKKKTGKAPSHKGKGKGKKKATAKSRSEAANKAWKTRRQKYGKDGLKG